MAGIFGIVHLGERAEQPVRPEDLERMGHALRHLGPDGVATSRRGPVGMGHLAFDVDQEALSVRSRPPFASAEHDVMVTADLRLDNRSELATRLEISPRRLGATPDRELLRLAYLEWGVQCTRHLLGEFAFAIWDGRERQLFCARDPFGLRPFYYHHAATRFVFSSQMNGLCGLPYVSKDLNERYLARYLRVPLPPTSSTRTVYRDIHSLKAGRQLVLRDGDLQRSPYWEPASEPPLRFRKDDDYADALREEIVEAVRRRLRRSSGAQVGVTLSGGLDSSAVACIAARALREEGRELFAFSAVLPREHAGVERDEKTFIDAVRRQEPNLVVHHVTPSADALIDELDPAIAEARRPVSHYYYVDRALWRRAREANVRILLSGLGGDQTVSQDGRGSLFALVRQLRLGEIVALARQLHRVEGESYRKIVKGRLIHPLISPRFVDFYRRAGRSPSRGEGRLATAANLEFARRLGVEESELRQAGRARPHDHAALFRKLQEGRFAVGSDRIRMSHFGIEGLYPYYDRPLIELCLRMPPEQYLAGGIRRSVFRRAMEGILPPEVQWRPGKSPYSPDLHRRVSAAGPRIRQMLASLGPADVSHRYLDLDRIRDELDRAVPAAGRHDFDSTTVHVVLKGVILSRFLQQAPDLEKTLPTRSALAGPSR